MFKYILLKCNSKIISFNNTRDDETKAKLTNNDSNIIYIGSNVAEIVLGSRYDNAFLVHLISGTIALDHNLAKYSYNIGISDGIIRLHVQLFKFVLLSQEKCKLK